MTMTSTAAVPIEHVLEERSDGHGYVMLDCPDCDGVSNGGGHARCMCGETSSHLTSYVTRKRWHHAHVRDVRVGTWTMPSQHIPDAEELMTALADYRGRMQRDSALLLEMSRKESNPVARNRLAHKAEGVRLALGKYDEMMKRLVQP